MRRPSRGNEKKGDADDKVPPGGRARQRIQQDRAARGLGEIPEPVTLTLEDDRPTGSKRKRSTRKTKAAGRS